jgi:16S rRNA (cytosine1402-N4)-methyltransferase
MEYAHAPVLLQSVITGLNIQPNGTYIDGTCGGAGHAEQIAKIIKAQGGDGFLIGIDRDPDAVKAASERLSPYNAVVAMGNFDEMKAIAKRYDVTAADGILLDLGVSSYQLDNPERGFSFHNDAPLDMRMSKTGISAEEVVNNYPEEELVRILREYGEERFAFRIAAGIVEAREEKPLETTAELAQSISNAYPARFKREKNPCRKTFQALRIEVNAELTHVSDGLTAAWELLSPGGRLAVITFHSLEDRLVKQRFVSLTKGCTCPPDFPQCVCGKTAVGQLSNRKPITATDEELAANPRARSAKLRIIEKISD